MTETLQDMNTATQSTSETEQLEVEPAELEVSPSAAELDIARELVRSARARGVALTGPDAAHRSPQICSLKFPTLSDPPT